MFIREVVKTNKGSDKKFIYHLLVESYRTPKGPRQRTLLSLGQLSLPRQQWKALANRIEEIIRGQLRFGEPVSEEVERLAQHYAQLLIAKRLHPEDEPSPPPPQFESVDVDSLQSRECRSIGAEWVALSMLQRLGFGEYLSRLGFSPTEVQIAQLLIVGRMVAPGSEWSCWQWACHRSAIGELLGLRLSERSHNWLYRVGDRLYQHKREIEAYLTRQEQALFPIASHIILYDLTNSYFEGEIGRSQLKRYGRCKQKRHDAPLVTVGLVLNSYGFPLYSGVFEGNISEQQTLEEVLGVLSEEVSIGPQKPLVVLDAGVATESNLKRMVELGYDYVVVSRCKGPEELPASLGPLEVVRTGQEHRVEARLYRDGKESWLFCQSLRRAQKEASMRTLLQQRFEEALQSLAAGLHRKGTTKRYQKVVERIGRLREKHRRVSHYYEIELQEHNGVAVELRWWLREPKAMDDRFSGRYLLRSSRTDLTAQQIWHLYVMLTDVEDSFRSLKGELGLRPNYHQKDDRIRAHIFITVLAHHVVQCIQWYLHQKDCYLRWSSIRQALGTQQRLTSSFTTEAGKRIHVRHTSEPEAFHRFVADALGITPKPLARKKTIL